MINERKLIFTSFVLKGFYVGKENKINTTKSKFIYGIPLIVRVVVKFDFPAEFFATQLKLPECRRLHDSIVNKLPRFPVREIIIPSLVKSFVSTPSSPVKVQCISRGKLPLLTKHEAETESSKLI